MKSPWIARGRYEDVVSALGQARERIDSLEDQVKDLHQEMRERDRDWSARLAEVVSSPSDEADNLRALAAMLDSEEPPTDDAVPKTALTDYLAFLNGGETKSPIYWANDYLQPAGEDEDE